MSKNLAIKDSYNALAGILPDILLGNGLSYILPKIKGEFLVAASDKSISIEILNQVQIIVKDYQGGSLKMEGVDKGLSALCDSLTSKHQLGELTFADYNFTQTIIALNERQLWIAISIKETLNGAPRGSLGLKSALERIQENITEEDYRNLRGGESEGAKTDLGQLIYDLGEWTKDLFYGIFRLEKGLKNGQAGEFTGYIQGKILEIASSKYANEEYLGLERRLGDDIAGFNIDSRVEKRFYGDYKENINPFFLLDYFISLAKGGKPS